jgi:ABC transporter DrrB family efflux protein
MTVATARLAPPTSPVWHHRLSRQLAAIRVLVVRNLRHIAREPMQLSDVTLQPILFTALFVYIFGAGVVLAHGGSYANFAIAGMLTLNLTTSAVGTAVGLSDDLRTGIIDRFRSLPMWRPAVLVSRSLTDLLTAIVCTMFVCATGLLVGWRPGGSVISTIGGLAVVLLFAYGLSWGCACLGIVSKEAESAQGVAMVILFPMAFVSNALVPTAHMPAVLRAIADWNPVSAVTAACRQLMANPNPSALVHSWPMQHPIATSLIWSVGMIVVFAPLAAHLFAKRTRN